MRAILSSFLMTALALSAGIQARAQEQSVLSADSDASTGTETYPRISGLEMQILGQSYPGQPLDQRLSRMEQKAFGSVSIKPDLSDRADALDDYVQSKLDKKLMQANATIDTTNPVDNYASSNSSAPVVADYPHVTELERVILSQTYITDQLPDRLGRMEMKAFNKVSTGIDLADRTDALERYAEKKLHKPSLAQEAKDDNSVNSSGANNSGGLFSKVGQALIGMATPNLNGVGGTFGRGGGLGFGGGGLGGSGMGYGGMGGAGGLGMGNGGRRQQQAQQQQQQEPPPPKHQDDPAVFQPNPPDANARLITKVGWCEVKVYGHTFPDMHLTARLGQLNSSLALEPGKSNIQLMDDIGLMIKAVQARKQTAAVTTPK